MATPMFNASNVPGAGFGLPTTGLIQGKFDPVGPSQWAHMPAPPSVAPTGPIQATGMPGIIRQGNSFSGGSAPISNPYPASAGWTKVPGANGTTMEQGPLSAGYGPQDPSVLANNMTPTAAAHQLSANLAAMQPSSPAPAVPSVPSVPAFNSGMSPSASWGTPQAPQHGIGFNVGHALHQGLGFIQNAAGSHMTTGQGAAETSPNWAWNAASNAAQDHLTTGTAQLPHPNASSDLMKQIMGFGTGLGKGWNASA